MLYIFFAVNHIEQIKICILNLFPILVILIQSGEHLFKIKGALILTISSSAGGLILTISSSEGGLILTISSSGGGLILTISRSGGGLILTISSSGGGLI